MRSKELIGRLELSSTMLLVCSAMGGCATGDTSGGGDTDSGTGGESGGGYPFGEPRRDAEPPKRYA
jgi:hypothetical protein